MRKVERLWIQAIESGFDERLVNFLVDLKAVKASMWPTYMADRHSRILTYRREKDKKRSRSEAKSFVAPLRPPRSIKPTKTRFR